MSNTELSEEDVKVFFEKVNTGNLTDVEAFLRERDLDVNAVDKNGDTLLIKATFSNDVDVVNQLLSLKADPNIQNNEGETALLYAVSLNDTQCINALLKNQANPNLQNNEGVTPLLCAVERNNVQSINALLENNAIINLADSDGVTPTHMSLIDHNTECMDILVQRGGDVIAKDNKGSSLFLAAYNCHSKEDLDELVKKGIKINKQDSDGKTLLHYAVLLNNSELIQDLLDRGAKVDVKDNYDQTPLCYAVKGNKTCDVEALVDHGADVNAKTSSGDSILSYARDNQKKSAEYVSVLNKYGKLNFEYANDLRNALNVEDVTEFNVGLGMYQHDTGEIHIYRLVNEETEQDVTRGAKKQPEIVVNRQSEESVSLADEECNGNTVVHLATLNHEYNHRLDDVDGGIYNEAFTARENLRMVYNTEAIAWSSECLTASKLYMDLKNSGVEIFQYHDKDGKVQEMPIEALLSMYSKDLRDYVVKNGFNPDNQEDVKAVAKIGINYWHDNVELYSQRGDNFDQFATTLCSGQEKSSLYDAIVNADKPSEEYKNTLNRMAGEVYIGGNKTVNLADLVSEIDSMPKTENISHIAYGCGLRLSDKQLNDFAHLVRCDTPQNLELLSAYMTEKTGQEYKINDKQEYFNALYSLVEDENNIDLDNYKAYRKSHYSIIRKGMREQKGTLPELPLSEKNKATMFDKRVDKREQELSSTKEEATVETDKPKAVSAIEQDNLMYNIGGRE